MHTCAVTTLSYRQFGDNELYMELGTNQGPELTSWTFSAIRDVPECELVS